MTRAVATTLRPSLRAAAGALALAACASSPSAATRDRVDPDLTSRARDCEGTRVAEVRNDGAFPVDVYYYRSSASNPVFLRTLVRGAVEQIPLDPDARRVFTQASRQSGAPAGAVDRTSVRYLCADGA